jgi:hypothetical protein
MKRKYLFTFLGISIIFITSLIIYSCQKEKTGNNLNNRTDQSSMDLQLEKKIIDFRDQINFMRENPNLKSGGSPWEVDDAIYYIEALANYTYGDARYSREGYTIDSSFIAVPLTNGLIPAANIPGIYDQVIDSLVVHKDGINAREKQLIVADISLSGISGVAATFKVTSGFGTNRDIPQGNNYPWYWGWELGRCDNSGLGVGLDAADIIYNLANIDISRPSGYSNYYPDEYIEVWFYEVPTNNNPYGDYMLFYDHQVETLNHHCLSTDEISYYVDALESIANTYKPEGQDLIGNFCWDQTSYGICGGEDCWTMVHVAKFHYGIWHTSSNPPEEL